MDGPQYSTKDGCALRMYVDSAPNSFLTNREGRPIFDEVLMVEVIAPGSTNSIPVFELKRTFAEEFGMQPMFGPKYEEYRTFVEEFERGEYGTGEHAGTPLKEWTLLSRSQVSQYIALGIHTVEALSAVPDTRLDRLGPNGRQQREAAIAFLEDAKGSAHSSALVAENAALRADLEAQKAQTAELAAAVEALRTAQATPAPATPEPPVPATPEPPPTPAPTAKGGKAAAADLPII